MKKIMSVPNGFMGWYSLILPKKYTMKDGEGTNTDMKSSLELAFSRQKRVKLDITLL